MKCESKYIEQLKQSMNDPTHQDEERIEDALIKAANSLIQAKFQLDELDSKTKPGAIQVPPQLQNHSSNQNVAAAATIEPVPQIQIEDQQNHR